MGSLSQYVKTNIVDCIIKYMNIWDEKRHVPKDFMLVRYEDLHSNPISELVRIFEFVEVVQCSIEHIEEAVVFSSFQNMRVMENSNYFKIRPIYSNRKDENSYKTRKGKIGGYRDYLSSSEIEYLDSKMLNLHAFFGYNQ